ncbi:CHAT domain-containing protein [Alkalinema sp. FACHB-956]|uniref:CHAT domain-containing protein n=1 Tax=Alkalinema sp. FACHB-956 TaxID=2692768 RepID=UPI0016854F20|nr:CHAT domain-containing protein [Alkalinema sp. FACHB-956]MBD2329149.1 CHAT domain-containing protein [Alkalinema sp. FACHB-956]
MRSPHETFAVGTTLPTSLPTTPLSLETALPSAPSSSSHRAPQPQQLAHGLAKLTEGRQFYRAGRFGDAIAAWQTATQIYQSLEDISNEALSLSYLALAQQALNRWDAAQQAIDRSVHLLKTTDGKVDARLWAQVLNTKAQLLLNTNQAETALELWQQAQKYYETAKDPIGQLGTQINQSQALQQLGFYRRAKQQLDALMQTVATTPNDQVKMVGFQSAGNAWYSAGYYRDAKNSFTLALDLARQHGDEAAQSTILLNLGQLAVQMDEPNRALENLEAAEKSAQTPLQKVQAQVKQLRLMIEYDRKDLAIQLAPKLLEAHRSLPPSHAALYSAINFVASLNRLTQPIPGLPIQKLQEFMVETIQVAHQLGDTQAEAYALNELARLYAQHRQWQNATKVAQQSLTLARQLNSPSLISQAAWQLGLLHQKQGHRADAIQFYEEAVRALQSMRGDLVAMNPDIQFSLRESVEPVYRQLIELLMEGQPSQESLKRSRELIEALKVAELDNFFREACLDSVQQIDQIDPRATVIYPMILPDRLVLLLSQSGQPLRYYTTSIPQTEVHKTIADALAALNPVTGKQARMQALQALYDLLIRPAEADQAFKNTDTLVFVLDGKLQNIPMAALYDGKQYLIEKYAVALSPGMKLLPSKPLSTRQLQAVVAGISQSRNGFLPLPAVEQEVASIATVMGASPLVNQNFTRQALEEHVQDPEKSVNLVHLATHGQFSSRLDETFLLTWDGPLNIKELSELLKSREGSADQAINLLVLSACETAAGDDRSVLGLAGLAVKSGARSTVASLWPVKDKVASRLMAKFYQKLRPTSNTPSMTKAEALRQAQLDLIHNTDFKHPFFWSSFVIVGHWQ